MAIVLMEGFENSAPGGSVTLVTNAMTNTYPTGRSAGGVCLRSTQSSSSSYTQITAARLDAATAVMQVGMACRAVPLTASSHLPVNQAFLQLRENTTTHVYLRLNATSGAVEVIHGSGTTMFVSSFVPNMTSWNHFAIAATCHDTTGSVTVWLNGIQIIALTNVDTRNGGTGIINNAYFATATLGTGNNGAYVEVDDIYLSDSMAYVGDCRVVRLLPTGAGDVTAWTPSAGANWDAVNDSSSTDYVGTATAASKDLYVLSDLDPALTVIRAVQTDFLAWKSDAGAALDLREEARSVGGVDGAPGLAVAAAVLTTTPTWFKAPARNADPNGDPWTTARVNGLQVGVSVP